MYFVRDFAILHWIFFWPLINYDSVIGDDVVLPVFFTNTLRQILSHQLRCPNLQKVYKR
jgi:hypothetical protein